MASSGPTHDFPRKPAITRRAGLFFPMVQPPSYSTPATDELCRAVAKKCKTVFCAFSRGKDSLCTYLQLHKFFKHENIIPFHCASFPGLRHVKDTLDYYERVLGTRIVRLCGPELTGCLQRGMYQTLDDIDDLVQMDEAEYSMLDRLEYLRYTFNYPRAWGAFGIMANDSIDRQIYCRKIQGRNPQNLTFYPCWDWPRAEVLRAIREAGLKLSGEYRYVNRTMGGPPSKTCNEIFKKHYPEDWNTILGMYPLAEAKTLRELYLDRIYERRKAQGIVTDETEEEVALEESAADRMTDIGMAADGEVEE